MLSFSQPDLGNCVSSILIVVSAVVPTGFSDSLACLDVLLEDGLWHYRCALSHIPQRRRKLSPGSLKRQMVGSGPL